MTQEMGGAALCSVVLAVLLSGCVLRSGDTGPAASLRVVVLAREESPANRPNSGRSARPPVGGSVGQPVGPSAGPSVGEILLVERLTKAGFQVVPVEWGASGEMDPTRLLSADKGPRLRARLSDRTGADRLVVLVVTTEENDLSGLHVSGHGLVSWNATLCIEALDLKKGIILAAATMSKPGVGLSRESASRKAIEKAMDALLGRASMHVPAEDPPFMRDLRAGAGR